MAFAAAAMSARADERTLSALTPTSQQEELQQPLLPLLWCLPPTRPPSAARQPRLLPLLLFLMERRVVERMEQRQYGWEHSRCPRQALNAPSAVQSRRGEWRRESGGCPVGTLSLNPIALCPLSVPLLQFNRLPLAPLAPVLCHPPSVPPDSLAAIRSLRLPWPPFPERQGCPCGCIAFTDQVSGICS